MTELRDCRTAVRRSVAVTRVGRSCTPLFLYRHHMAVDAMQIAVWATLLIVVLAALGMGRYCRPCSGCCRSPQTGSDAKTRSAIISRWTFTQQSMPE